MLEKDTVQDAVKDLRETLRLSPVCLDGDFVESIKVVCEAATNWVDDQSGVNVQNLSENVESMQYQLGEVRSAYNELESALATLDSAIDDAEDGLQTIQNMTC